MDNIDEHKDLAPDFFGEDDSPREDLHNIEISGLTQEELDKLTDWLNGTNQDVPDFLRVVSAQMGDKINFSMNYVLANYMRRIFVLCNYIESVEGDIYNAETLMTDDPEEKSKKYAKALTTLNSLLAFTNNYKHKNKDNLNAVDSPTKLLSDMLLGLSKERIESIINAINQGKI